jgi:hypothetical protein
MTADFIHVTRWDNEFKTFVDVGLLCESDGLEKPFPAVSFTYTDGYLDKYAPLYPKKLLRPDASTLINDADYNATLPKAFTPYLPSNTMKNALSSMIEHFDDMTPFQQLKAVTNIKGDFGAVQLNYDNETQFNALPHNIEKASHLLDIMNRQDYGSLSMSDVNAVYDYDTHNPSVRMVRWNSDDSYSIATVSKAESLTKAKQSLMLQGVMEAAGVDVLDVSIATHEGLHYIVQYDPQERITRNSADTVIADAIHLHPLMSTTKHISDETNLCAAEVSNLCKSIGGNKSAKEIFTRSVVSQVLNQRDFNIDQVKFKSAEGKWKLSPQLVNPITEDVTSVFQLPLVSGQSNQVKYAFKEIASPMLARAFGITSRQQEKIIDTINDAFSSVAQIAESKSISIEHAYPIQQIHEKSGLFKVTPSTVPTSPNNSPNMDQ